MLFLDFGRVLQTGALLLCWVGPGPGVQFVDCCAANPSGTHFCRQCGRLLTTRGNIHNPLTGDAYAVIDVLAEGGMSYTYLIYNFQIRRLAVLKEIRAELAGKAKAQELFVREARILQSLEHPGIPKFYDFFSNDDYNSLVMELIHGASLEQIQPASAAQAVDWMVEAAGVLDYLHRRDPPIIHRDIKPGNLLLRYNPREIVLIDYGAVKEASAAPDTRIATPGYAAPEQQQGRPCLQSDFYGIGTTLVYLLTGRFPGDFYNPRARRLVGLEEAGIEAALAEVIYRATAYDQSDRPRDCGEMIACLRPFTGTLQGL